MAKKRRVTRSESASSDLGEKPSASAAILDPRLPMMIAAAILGGAMVYLCYHPSDSVAVENGDALWFGVIAILLSTIAWGASLWTSGYQSGASQCRRFGVAIDAIPWLLALWMTVAAFATCPPGQLRFATNEAWLWISGAAVFSAARRLVQSRQTQAGLLALTAVCATGLAVHGLHQQFISLPQDRAAYRQDADAQLRKAGIDAPAGSAERMVYESRLFDGGPTGTFALANSLAGVLVVGVIALLGLLRFSWTSAGTAALVAICIALGLAVVCLVAVRSRSALLATAMSTVLLFVWSALSKHSGDGRSAVGLVVKTACAFVVFLVASIFGLSAFADAEWIEQAPASVAFRLQYWRSTLAMTLDRPWFSAGPGNFQSMYLRYREDSASEQIAEPHNFLFETMSSGGFPALVLLAAVLVSIALYLLRRGGQEGDVQQAGAADGSLVRWVWLGGAVALVLVWLIGAAAGRVPDFRAHCFAVPLAIAAAVLLWPAARCLRQDQLTLISSSALFGLLVHLLASGGWTIPGVAIYVWLFASMLTRIEFRDRDAHPSGSPGWSLAAIAAGMLLLATLRSASLMPVESAQLAIAEFEYAHEREQPRRAEAALEAAVQADPWSPAAALWRADLLHWQLIGEGNSAELRRSWQRYVTMAKGRAGESPSAWEVVGRQQLHLYQRFGDQNDLVAAEETFTSVVRWNPADQHSVAQLAAIAQAVGGQSATKKQQTRAKKLADRAFYLSQLGNNIERSLERQLIYVPAPQGLLAARKPVLAPASDLLSNQFR